MPEPSQYATPAFVQRLWHGLAGSSGLGILTVDAGRVVFTGRRGSTTFDYPLTDITTEPVMRSGTKFPLTTADGRRWLVGFRQDGRGAQKPLRVNPMGVPITNYESKDFSESCVACDKWHKILTRPSASTSAPRP